MKANKNSKKSSLGKKFVTEHGLFSSLNKYLPPCEQVKPQLLTRRTYNKITEQNIEHVRITKKPLPITWIEWGARSEYHVKNFKTIVLNGQIGVHCGEVSKQHVVLEGHGIFDSRSELFLGSFNNGNISQDHKYILINKDTGLFEVNGGTI